MQTETQMHHAGTGAAAGPSGNGDRGLQLGGYPYKHKDTRMEIFEGMGIDRAYTNRMFYYSFCGLGNAGHARH